MNGAATTRHRARLLLEGGALAALIVLSASASQGHERSASYASWIVDGTGAEVTLRIDSRDLTRLPEAAGPASTADGEVAAAVAAALIASRDGHLCRPTGPPSRVSSAAGKTALRWRVACPTGGRFELESRLPQLLRTAHLCFVRIRLAETGAFEVVLHDDQARWQPPQSSGPSRGNTLLDSLLLGLCHIASGTDHLFFVAGLVVIATTLSEVALVVTAFTFAHTFTLVLAALGVLRPAAPSIEALIAVSIALLAVENLTLRGGGRGQELRHPSLAAAFVLTPALVAAGMGLGRVPLLPLAGTSLFALCYLAFARRRPQSRPWRWLVAFVFGLLHGFGFAGALLESGFSDRSVAATLLAFNVGVEAGQLLFVAGLWPLIVLARRGCGDSYGRLVVEPVSVALLAASVGWYVARAAG